MSGVAVGSAAPAGRSTRLTRLLPAALFAWALAYAFLGRAAGWFAHDLLRLSSETRFGSAVAFFVFEVPKVLLLLTLVVFAVGVVAAGIVVVGYLFNWLI